MSDPALSPVPEAVIGTHTSRQVQRLRSLSLLLDSAFTVPGTPYRIGLDGVIGLVPGIGDAIGALFSGYIIFQAARLGAPKATLARMILNVGLDTLVGEIPLLGDLFDFGFKSNIKNVNLLEAHLGQPRAARTQSRRILVLLGLGLVVLLVALVALGVIVAQLVLRSVS